MYKGNKTVLPRILSLILATGLTLSGVPVGVIAAETSDAAVQQTVQEAEEEAAPEEEEEESASSEQEEEKSESSEQEEEESASTEQEEEQETPQEEATTQDEDKAETAEEQEPEEEKDVEKAPAPAKAGTVEDAAEDVENSNGSDEAAAGTVIEKTAEFENIRDASANDVIPDGLYTEDGYTYYYENGSYVTNRIVEIEGSLYYFDDFGWMVNDELISVYDYNAGEWFYYRASEDGSLITSDWYQDEEGWQYFDGKGHRVTENVIMIDGTMYGFDGYGFMYCDQSFYFYDEDSETFSYYRAKSDGKLYVNEWYSDEWNKYYYGENGAAPHGPYEVDGTLYLFKDWEGQLAPYNSYSSGDDFYVSDENGVAYLLENGTGWVQIDGSWRYYKDKEMISMQVIKIGDEYYGFDWYGNIYCDQQFSTYDEDTDTYSYYSAKSDGKLYVNEWYSDEWGNRYYYRENAAAAIGPYEVDGTLYLFSDSWGQLLTNGSYSAGNDFYISDENGVAHLLENGAGWIELNGSWYYYKDKERVYDKVIKIGDDYYGFDWDGHMYSGQDFSIYDYDSDTSLYYRAKSDGKLYVNEWYSDEWDRYYYGENGAAPRGPFEIDGTLYLFSDWGGYLLRNSSYISGEEFYVSDTNGVAHLLKNGAGWIEIDGTWYYYKDRERVENQVIKIGEKYYGFDWDGQMYDDQVFDLYDSGSGKWIYYRAHSGGVLYAGEWYDSYGNWYYYDSDAKGADGPKTIKNITYVFEDARMLTNTTWSEGNTVYIIGADGVAKKVTGTGWIEANGDWYYSKDGKMLKSCVEKIGNAYYGFNYSGRMYSDSSFYRNGYAYRAKPDGTLYVNSWVQRGSNWYYYGAEGKGAEGLVTLGGKTYLFDEAEMLTDTATTINGVTYVADSNGIVKKLDNGWSNVGDEWYYVENNRLYSDGVYLINNKYYGFDGNGRMYNNETFSIYDYNDNDIFYRAQAGGVLYVNSWVLDCSWYYYGTAGKALKGKQKVDGKDYYFDYNGEMLANGYVNCDGKVYQAAANGVLSEVKNADLARMIFNRNAATVAGGASLRNTWKQYGGKWYYFDEDGIAVRGHQYINGAYYYFDDDNVMQTGWIHNGDGVMYADSNGKLVSGEKKLDGKWYYFTDDGWMQTGIVYYNDKVYLCGKDGAYIKAVNKNGWTENGGTWYYFRDGEMLTGQEAVIGNQTYYFNYNGEMVTNEIHDGRIYDANGHKVTKGWYKYGAEWYYVKDGHCVDGDQTIDGKKYYFNRYRMFVGEREVDGELQTYDASGALTKTVKLNSKNGWTLFGGDYYYYANGKPYTGWVGNYYVSDGVMQTDKVIDGYYVNELGVWVKTQGWTDHNIKYVKANGKVAMNEWVQISGSWYYFNSAGNAYRNDCYTIGTKQYAFDSSGKWITTADNLKDETKWVSAGGKWYYISKGLFVDGDKTIDGKDYYFVDGKMSTNSLHYNDKKDGYVWYGADGTMANLTGWNRVDGKWYWFNQDSTVPTGWVKVNGKTYYIYYYEGMVTGVTTISDKVYQFDSSGAFVKQINKQNGWFQSGSDWYYFKDGELLSEGIHMIDNVEYGFSGGKLASNQIIGTISYYYDGDYYVDSNCKYFFVDGSGKVSHSTGWKKVHGTWYYFGTNGIMLTGIQNINGTMYNFGYDYDYDYYYN